MAQLASCPCANVSLQLTSGPDTAFHIQDDPRLHLHGFQATALPHSIQVTHPHLTSILDPDHCRLKWLVCGNCTHVIYGVENDDEQALPLLLLPLDHKLVVTPHLLVGPDAESLPARHPRFSLLYKVVVPTSRSFGPEVPGTELTPELRSVLTQLDATYAAHVAKETAAIEARIAAFREAELAKLKAMDARAAEERDCLFAAAVRLRRGVTLTEDEALSPPGPVAPTAARIVNGGGRSGLLPSSLGVSASINTTTTAAATSEASSRPPATAASAMNPTLDVTLSASFRPAVTAPLPPNNKESETGSPPLIANRRRQRTLTGGMPMAAANGTVSTALDGDMFMFDDDDDQPPPALSSPSPSTGAAMPEDPVAATSDTDFESDVDDSPMHAATAGATKFGTSLPMSIPPPMPPAALTSSASRSRQPSSGAADVARLLAPPLALTATPLPSGDPPAGLGGAVHVPVGDGTADEDLGGEGEDEEGLAHVGRDLPPHAYLAKTYAVAPGAFVVGSKPAGIGGRGFSFKG